MKKPRHAKEILDAFESVWGFEKRPFVDERLKEPLDDLMLTVLSQNTNDKNRDKAYDRLRAKYPAWEAVLQAPLEDIIEQIRIAGLGETKASNMKRILAIIKEKFGRCSIKELAKWEPKDVREFLVSLPGVGVKTAGVVMVFDLGMPAFPVDTHVARISRRLGWAPEKMPPDKIQLYLESTLPPSRFGGAHLNIITHGRNVCGARRPKCEECPAGKWCDFANLTKSLDG